MLIMDTFDSTKPLDQDDLELMANSCFACSSDIIYEQRWAICNGNLTSKTVMGKKGNNDVSNIKCKVNCYIGE